MKRKELSASRRTLTRQFFAGNSLAFAGTILETIFTVSASLVISWLMQQLIDAATGAEGARPLGELSLIAMGSVLLLAMGFLVAYHTRPRFVSRAIGQYQNYVFRKLSQKSIAAFSGENTALYISALSNDTTTIEMNYLCNIFLLVDNILLFVGGLAMMLYYSPLLTAISLGLAMLPVLVSIPVGNRVAAEEKRVSERNESYMSTLKDSLSGFPVVKSFRAEAAMCQLFAQQVKAVTDAKSLRRKMTIIVQALGSVAGTIAQIGVFLIGAWMAVSGKGISAGVVIVFVQLMNFVLNPLGSIPKCLAEWKAARGLIDKLAQALEQNVREEGEPVDTALTDGIRVETLSFSYEPEKEVLRQVSIHFEAGKRYAIVGGSGSGKSTLLNLLMAAHSNYDGQILVDGQELRSISSDSLYELMTMVQQNVFVFNASIRDNITMFRQFPKEEVDRAICLSGLKDLIDQRGEDYLCGENGSGLSGGEKQRVSIARTLLRKSSVLLVDEATAALDAQTAYQVMDSILSLEDMTRIVVTHSLDEGLLRRYDRILTLKNGVIAEAGTFEELMAKKGYFYSLYTVAQ